MSDWGAQHTSIGSALNGLDMAMPGDGNLWGGALTSAVLQGTIPQWRLDDMVVRIMAAYFKIHVGNNTERVPINFSAWTNQTYGFIYFSANRTVAQVNEHINVQGNHKDLIREMGAKSVVLLKNVDGILPLRPNTTFAVIGEDAQDNMAGPNGCEDRGCDTGTLAMAWGSGTSQFPYLVSPAKALEAQATRSGLNFTNIKGNYDLAAAQAAAASVEVPIVFANADAGENYIIIGGNAGDRNNLTLWKGGDALIQAVASVNPKTIVVLHTVGPVLIDAYKNHPNISAILWAGLPGQESGNSLVDVLYGATNPQGKSPFTWGMKKEDWGVSLLYTSPRPLSPSQDIKDALIDYRYFDKHDIEPSYEFGFGLSYTAFAYSDLVVKKQSASPYHATAGVTPAAPTYGLVDNSTAGVQDAMMPAGFSPIPKYVYSWLPARGLTAPPRGTQIPEGSQDGSPQPVLPASGAPGGNRGLYEVLYKVSATVKNTGNVAGTEIAQLVGTLLPWPIAFGFDSHDAVSLLWRSRRTSPRPPRLRRDQAAPVRIADGELQPHIQGLVELGFGESELGAGQVQHDRVCRV
jgi:beta-glucosidase